MTCVEDRRVPWMCGAHFRWAHPPHRMVLLQQILPLHLEVRSFGNSPTPSPSPCHSAIWRDSHEPVQLPQDCVNVRGVYRSWYHKSCTVEQSKTFLLWRCARTLDKSLQPCKDRVNVWGTPPLGNLKLQSVEVHFKLFVARSIYSREICRGQEDSMHVWGDHPLLQLELIGSQVVWAYWDGLMHHAGDHKLKLMTNSQGFSVNQNVFELRAVKLRRLKT